MTKKYIILIFLITNNGLRGRGVLEKLGRPGRGFEKTEDSPALPGGGGGITGVLCVIFLQFIAFSLKKKNIQSIDIWDINAHQVLLVCPHFMGGGPHNLGNARI